MTTIDSEAPALPRPAAAWAGWVWLAAEWACVLAAVALWSLERPPAGLVLLALPLWAAAWVARWLRSRQLTRPTPLDWPLGLFMLTALVGLWAAPDRTTAIVRLDFFLGAAGLYYALVNSPATARQLFGYGLGLVAALLALYFATQNNWSSAPAKFALIGRLGGLLNRHTPQLGLYQPNPNVVANLLALALPVSVVLVLAGLQTWRAAGWRRLALVAPAGSALVIVFGLGMTESRASALALGAAAGLAVWWWLAGQAGRRLGRDPLPLFAAGVAVVMLAGVVFALAAPGLLTVAFGSLPGPNSAISRTELFGQVWHLAQATPFTGGGLGAFPGLYSTYILDVPNLYLTHAHNAYLNILVEQGWPGLLSFVLVLAAGVMAGVRQLRRGAAADDALIVAGLLSLAVLLVQGLGDGTLVASRIALAWLLPAGLAVGGLVGPRAAPALAADSAAPARHSPGIWRRRAGWALAGGAALAVVALFTWHSWAAAWYANLGSVAFARVQLRGWPTNAWSDGHEAGHLAAVAQPDFERALALNPANVTALYRLGLLAGLQRNYSAAAQDLAEAHGADPGDRGVTKALAYADIWSGDPQAAAPLLRAVPEAASEMAVYTWWWGTQGRPDLARLAGLESARLGAAP